MEDYLAPSRSLSNKGALKSLEISGQLRDASKLLCYRLSVGWLAGLLVSNGTVGTNKLHRAMIISNMTFRARDR